MNMKKLRPTKLLAKKHTAKLRHHKHTSYGSLLLILVLVLVPVFGASRAVAADAGLPPVTDSEGVFGVVAGPVPKTAPTIQNLTSGQVFTTSDPVRIQGSCPAGTLVKVFKNEVFAGGTLCQNGSYQLSIDLFIGDNSLIARAYNTNDVASPDSVPVSVTLSLPGSSLDGTSQLSNASAANQYYVTSELSHRGAEVGATMTWPLILSGGTQPYAVSVSWGDGKTDLVSRQSPGRFDISHVYESSGGYRGSYQIIIKSTDAAGNKSYLQLTSIVSGGKKAVGIAGSVSGGYNNSPFIKVAWQLLAATFIAVLAFWLGEKRELRVVRARAGKPA